MIERVLGNVSRVLGFVPTMTYSGTLDAVPEIVLQDLLAVVNEALSNVARHAGATAVSVELAGSADEVLLRVTDDGRGIGPATRSSGLSNMRARAERHHGSFRLVDNEPRGTVLEWRVPLGSGGSALPLPLETTEGDGSQPATAHERPAPVPVARTRDISAGALLLMLDELPALVGAYDDRGRNLYANRAHATYYELTPEDVLGRHVSEVLGSRLYEASRRQLNEVLTGREQQFERTLHDAAGRERHMHVSYVPDVVDGEVRGFYSLATDISARIRAEEALDESNRQMTLLEERQRIAANLHDMVIQRLFAAGLDLAAAQRGRPDAADRIERAAGAVDESIRELRGAIHSLRELMVPRQLPTNIEEIIGRAAQQLGFVPTVTYTGSLDAVPEAVAKDVIAVVDEALTNVAQHAGASAVMVVLACSSEHVVAQVVDDGQGPGNARRGDGITDMQARAERHGGWLSFRPNHPHGTVVEWLVPLTTEA
jgi:PAS domain S-box-containing protein